MSIFVEISRVVLVKDVPILLRFDVKSSVSHVRELCRCFPFDDSILLLLHIFCPLVISDLLILLTLIVRRLFLHLLVRRFDHFNLTFNYLI